MIENVDLASIESCSAIEFIEPNYRFEVIDKNGSHVCECEDSNNVYSKRNDLLNKLNSLAGGD